MITRTSIIPSSFPRRNSGDFRETGVIASSAYLSIRCQINKMSIKQHFTSFLKDVQELKHENITLSSLVRRALNATCSILICFSCQGGGVLAEAFSGKATFSLPPHPGYLKVPIVVRDGGIVIIMAQSIPSVPKPPKAFVKC